MREILFKGKTINNKLSVEGFYYIKKGNYFIIDKIGHSWKIIPESIREFTGYFDEKNKRKVFEGDLYEIEGNVFEVKFINHKFILINSDKINKMDLDYIGCINAKFLGTRFETKSPDLNYGVFKE